MIESPIALHNGITSGNQIIGHYLFAPFSQ